MILLTVSDDGIGMSQEKMERILQKPISSEI